MMKHSTDSSVVCPFCDFGFQWTLCSFQGRKGVIAQAYWDFFDTLYLDRTMTGTCLIFHWFRCHNVRPGPEHASWNCTLAGGNNDHLRPDQSWGPRQCATCITAKTQVREAHINTANRDVIDQRCCRPHALCHLPNSLPALDSWSVCTWLCWREGQFSSP